MSEQPIIRKTRSPRLGVAVGWLVFWLAWPFWHVLLSGTKRVRIVVFHGEYILLERSYVGAGAWGLPGGGMHASEPVLAAARRELHEETGLHVPEGAMRVLGDASIADGGIRYRAYYVVAEVEKSALDTAIARAEVNEICWIPRQQLSTIRTMPSVRAALQLWEHR